MYTEVCYAYLILVCIRSVGSFFHREVLTSVDRFTALRFTATGASPAERRMRILPVNQYACWPITYGMKSQEVLKMPALYT
jgi:hypothetical protein